MARRRRSTLMGKQAIQHAHSFVDTIGGATAPQNFIILNPNIGARSTDGSAKNFSTDRDTSETVNIGDVVKYVNMFVECGPRNAQGADTRTGWLEWAFVCVKQTETAVPITQMGVLTLGTVCTNMFRNECIFTGAFPVGSEQPNNATMHLKIPKFKQSIKAGDEWRFLTYFRDMVATSTSTTGVRVIKSYMYKAYQ